MRMLSDRWKMTFWDLTGIPGPAHRKQAVFRDPKSHEYRGATVVFDDESRLYGVACEYRQGDPNHPFLYDCLAMMNPGPNQEALRSLIENQIKKSHPHAPSDYFGKIDKFDIRFTHTKNDSVLVELGAPD